MRIELKGKAKIITVIAVFLIALATGLLLENLRNDKFTVETISQTATAVPTESAVISDAADESKYQEKTIAPPTGEPLSVSETNMVSNGKININTADAETLTLIKGIGESLAKRIIDYRTEHGPFETIEEIVNVSGIGEKKLNDMRDVICVE